MISTRYSAAVALLLALALVPTAIHSYWGAVSTDQLTVSAISTTLDGAPSVRTERRAAWAENVFESRDWIERVYSVRQKPVTLFAARSYDAKRLYHHPELAALRGTQTTPLGIRRSSRRPAIPLHVMTTERNGQRGIGVYALLYDGAFIENPVAFQLQTSAALLLQARKPMTLFLTSDLSGSPSAIDEAPATRVLLAAIAAFEQQAPVTTDPEK